MQSAQADCTGRTERRRAERGLVGASATRTAAAHGLADLILDFLGYLELERGLSRNTLEAYRSDLLQFGEFLAGRELAPLWVAHADLAAFGSELADGANGRRPVAAATLQRKIACLRSFYRHLRRDHMI